MFERFKGGYWAGLLALWLGLAAAAGAQSPAAGSTSSNPAPMELKRVSERVWYVEGLSALGSASNRNFISNAGFIVTPAGVVVIDALGSPALAQELMQQIARITPQPVTHVLVTHYHADHIYGLQAFEERGARILAHEAAREYLQSDTARLRLQASREELGPWIDAQTRIVPPQEWISAPRVLQLGGVEIEIQPVGPAHTPEDLVVFVRNDRVLFAGDLVFRSRIPFVGQANSKQWIHSLEQLLKYDARVVVPGHGPLSESARTDMQLTRDYLAHLRKHMGAAARDLIDFDEAYARTDWSAFEHLPLFRVANRMNAYNTYLLMETEPE